MHTALRLAGERIGKAEIGGIDQLGMIIEHLHGSLAVAQRGLGEREAQHGARVFIAKVERVAEAGRSRLEAPSLEIGGAQQSAEPGVARIGQHGGFGVRDGLFGLPLGKRGLRAGKGDIAARCR